jgi:hypothetical protein
MPARDRLKTVGGRKGLEGRQNAAKRLVIKRAVGAGRFVFKSAEDLDL